MQVTSASQLVLALPVSPPQPQAPGPPKNASHLLASQVAQSVLPVSSQVALHAKVKLPAGVFGGSHCSLGWLITPSPQVATTMFWQSASQVLQLGGSHCSGMYGPSGASTTLLPQTG